MQLQAILSRMLTKASTTLGRHDPSKSTGFIFLLLLPL